jgi:hypothetical protein
MFENLGIWGFENLVIGEPACLPAGLGICNSPF